MTRGPQPRAGSHAVPEVVIRAATPGDAAEIANVHVSAWREAYQGLLPAEFLASLPLAFRRRMRMWAALLGASDRPIFVAEATDHGVVGFVAASPPRDRELAGSGELSSIYLLRSYQRCGIGRALLERAFAVLRAGGYRSAYCWVIEHNPSVAFYRRTGALLLPDLAKHKEIGEMPVTERVYFWDDLSGPDGRRLAPGMHVRPAGPGDGERIAEAHVDAILSLGGAAYDAALVADWASPRTGERYRRALAAGERMFVAVDDGGQCLGFSAHRVEDGVHRTAVYVRGSASRRGLGTALYAAAEAVARADAATEVVVDASLVAVPFYAANGFHRGEPTVHTLRSGRAMACVRMCKRL